MSDRSVTYTFKGDFRSLTAGLAVGGKSVHDFGDKLTALDKQGAKMRAGLKTAGDTAGKFGLVAAAGLGAIALGAANFDKAMSGVQAATRETTQNMKELREAALQAGADTAFSATEAAAGIENLAKAGVSTEAILSGGLRGALDLAAAGSVDVAQAGEIAATAMKQFGLAGADIPHIADLLAAAAGKAQGEVTDMANALKYVGPVAHQMGISIEETAGAIAELASQGILGDQAGTSLRGMLTSLTSPSAMAAKEMKKLHIEMYDANGQFVGLNGIAGELQENMTNLTAAERDQSLGRIFGNEQVTAARILYAGGAKDVDKWTDAVNDQGYAAEQAALKMDNLRGDLERLQGSLETALIGAGSGSQGPLRSTVQGLEDTVNAFNDLPGPMKTATTSGLALAAVLGGSAFVGTRVVSGMASTTSALTEMGMSAERATKTTRLLGKAMGATAGVSVFALGMSNANEALGSFEATAGGALAGFAVGGPWGAAIGGAAGLFASLAHDAGDATGELEAFTAALDEQTGALTENNRTLAQKALQDAGAFDAAERLGLNLALVTDAALGNAEALAQVNAETERWAFSAERLRAGGTDPSDSDNMGQSLVRLQDALNGTNNTVEESSKAWQQNKEASGDAAKGIDNASGAAATAAPRFATMSAELKASRKAASESALGFVNLGEKVNKAKVSLGGWLKELEKQADALRNFRVNAEEAAEKGLNQGLISALQQAGPEGALRMKQLANATDEEIARANRAWKRGQREIKLYTDEVGGVPEVVATDVRLTGAKAARQALADIIALAHQVPRSIRTEYIVNQLNATNKPKVERATGGSVFGPGTETSDSIPTLLSTNEHVWSAREVRGAGGHAALERMRALARMGALPHFADGGRIRPYDAPRFRDGGAVRVYAGQSAQAASVDLRGLAAELAPMLDRQRPLYGDVHMQPHNYSEFRREMDRDRNLAGMDRLRR